jgi:electron transfer flavoprotein-quinone oxidoreductase
MTRKFDVIVVGAGPAGNAAALTLAQAGLEVLQLERGEYPGAKNVQGAILYADAVEKIVPDFRRSAPLERHIIEQRMWMVDDRSHIATSFRSEAFKDDAPNRYTIIRAEFDKWFSGKVKQAGALVICETTVVDLLRDGERVIGVRTDRQGGDILADVVILADGVNSLVAGRAKLRPPVKSTDVALAVKETHYFDKETINQRFNLKDDEGVVIEMMGKITKGMVGTAFLYTNMESISLGIGCMLEDFRTAGVPPYKLLEELKAHPSVHRLIAGGEVKEYSAHLIPEGGYEAIPKIHGDGWMIGGDSAGFVNAVHREGSNLAMTSGRFAAETVIDLKARGLPPSAANLAVYRKKLEDSFVMKDLKKYRRLPKILHGNRQFLTAYPELLNQAAHSLLTVDGVDKLTKSKEIRRAFLRRRSPLGVVLDAWRVYRSLR